MSLQVQEMGSSSSSEREAMEGKRCSWLRTRENKQPVPVTALAVHASRQLCPLRLYCLAHRTARNSINYTLIVAHRSSTDSREGILVSGSQVWVRPTIREVPANGQERRGAQRRL